jgi:hypothetical protein
MRTTITHGSLQQHPVVIFTDALSAGNHHPRLATVIDGQSDIELDVFTRYESWDLHSGRIVQVLPCTKAEGSVHIQRTTWSAACFHHRSSIPVLII